MENHVKNADNTGIYMGHGEFLIGGKFYLINPARVKNVCYDDKPNEEKIILEFNHPDNRIEYYCLDGLQLEWNKIKRDFIKFWNTNARDIEKCVADTKELKGLCDEDDLRLNNIKTCRKYYLGSDEFEKRDGKPKVYSKEEYLLEIKKRKSNEIKFYEEQKRMRKEMIEKEKENNEVTQEQYEQNIEWLEEKYAFLKDENWLNNGANWLNDNIDTIIERI
jgi:hypothetical protein